jgi:putative ABC transport system substrate-binding protein
MRVCLRRREFIAGLGGAVAAWPLAADGQQRERMRHVGMLLPGTHDDVEFQACVGAFLQGLAQSGWISGRNVQIEARWAGAKAEDIRRHAQELAALAPDVILAHGRGGDTTGDPHGAYRVPSGRRSGRRRPRR